MPTAITRTVGQNGQIAAPVCGLKPAAGGLSQFVGGKGGNLVEDVAVRQFSCIEESDDFLRHITPQCDSEDGEGVRLLDDVFERSVTVIFTPTAIQRFELGWCDGLIQTLGPGVFNEKLTRSFND